MKIKRFTCSRCGAPKVNAYSSPYIVCDFCGNFTDIDLSVGMDAWNKDEKRTNAYNNRKMQFENDLAELLYAKKEKEYRAMQYEYWDMYYKAYPEYLPPCVQGEELYKKYVDIAVDYTADYYFKPDPNLKKMEDKFNALQAKIKYTTKGNKTIADGEAFYPFFKAYHEYMLATMKDFYDNPDYALFHDLLPMDLHIKLKMSMFVQAWLPYLDEQVGEKMLKELHYSTEYAELKKTAGQEISCSNCKKNLFAPEGSYKVHCESCHTNTAVKTVFNCVSCSNENPVPENPAREVECVSCKTVNRLITPMFG